MIFKYIFISLSIIFLFRFPCINQKQVFLEREKNVSNYKQSLDSLLKTTSPRSFNGLVLITKKGKTIYSKAIGYSDFESKKHISFKDKFRIMSNSKQITAVLVLKEVEKGKIDLHAPVKKYLPEIKQTWADTVTTHHLLNFSAGISEIDKPLLFSPGTDFMYGVTTYTMLAQILEKVTGQKFTSLANNLFQNLGMVNSYCYDDKLYKDKVINGYINTANSYRKTQPPISDADWYDFIPAGGMISDAKDLNIWDTKLHKGKILHPSTYQLMTSYSISAQHIALADETIGYGYGIRINDKSPIKYIGHAGKGLGFTSLKIFFPQSDVDLIILENQYSEDNVVNYHFEAKIRDIVLNSELVK